MPKYIALLFGLLLIAPVGLAKPPAGELPPVMVETARVQEEQWQEQVQATGVLVAEQAVMLKPEISGKIDKLFFHSGQSVKAHAPLLQINASTAKAKLDYAQAQASLSAADYRRAKALMPTGALSKADLDHVTAAYKANQANAAQAQAEFAQTLIRAPFSGRLGLQLVNLGDYVTPGQNLVELQTQDLLRVDFSVPELYLSKVVVGQTVLLQISGLPQQSFTGKVYALAAGIDPSTHTLAIRASVPNPKHQLMPGSFTQITLLLGQPHKVTSIPQLALATTEDGSYVYRIVNQKAVKTDVIAGEQYQNRVAITQGLQAGENVVIAGQLKLHDGASVMLAR